MTYEVKLCRDCAHSMPEPGSEWNLRCMNPIVNKDDPYALSSSKLHGSGALSERARRGIIFDRPQCGMSGKLFKRKVDAS